MGSIPTARWDNQMTQLLTEPQAAELLNVSVSWLRASRCKTRQIEGPPFIRFGRAVRYSPDDLNAYMNRNRVGGA